MATEKGKPCPTCGGKELTQYVALKPLMAKVAGSDTEIVATLPHKYAVGRKCYLDQFAQEYPGEDAPDLPPALKPEKV